MLGGRVQLLPPNISHKCLSRVDSFLEKSYQKIKEIKY